MLSWNEIEERAVKFQKYWKNCKGNEKPRAQTFEKDFMNIFGVDFRDGLHEYKVILSDGSIGYIDYLFPQKIVIEMKSKGKSLATAYSQAMTYLHALKPDEMPKLLMTCDFEKIELYNLEKDIKYKPFKISQLKSKIRLFSLIAGYGDISKERTEIEVNTKASYKMAQLHDALKENGYTGHELEVYLVRILFCLFAEDTGIFEKETFENYIKTSNEDGSDLSMKIMTLLSTLNTSPENRMKNITEELKKFRYINGGLFSENLQPAFFDKNMRRILLECCEFNWSSISPAIFGAMFQGIMDTKTRREMGAHYTSEENIMKVINPLFLEDLYKEFEKSKNTKKEMQQFHEKISKLKFLDPACGCGNFLIVSYYKLRELEFEILKYLTDDKQKQTTRYLYDFYTKISVNQFYGIEYEEFASEVAKVSMVLIKHLMDQKISNYFGMNIIDFPIKENANIIHGNALKIEWEEVDYIFGNPPFVGKKLMSKNQQEDRNKIFKNIKDSGELDYVACWFKKANDFIMNKYIKVAFVSTNSITQGIQVSILWNEILKNNKIDFAYSTFKWNNEAKGKAKVFCVIIGFSSKKNKIKEKVIFYENKKEIVNNISPYITKGNEDTVVATRKPINGLMHIFKGIQVFDNGFYTITKEKKEEIEVKDKITTKYLKKIINSSNFLKGTYNYVFDLKNIVPEHIKKSDEIRSRIEEVKKYRLSSESLATRKKADKPHCFAVDARAEGNYIAIPVVSSSKRKYIPIDIINSETSLVTNQIIIVPTNELLLLGILMSNIHMAWVNRVGGKLKSDYRYSIRQIFNTFPMPNCSKKNKEKIRKTSQKILDIRKEIKVPLGDMYSFLYLYPELEKAHQENDKAVWEAYGKKWDINSDKECISYLMKLYHKLLKSNKE